FHFTQVLDHKLNLFRMGDRIFFKDKTGTLKGPFTERQVQEWYRDKWFENSFLFYFTRSDEIPSNLENSGITLDSLRTLNGIGCPFAAFDEKEKNESEKRREEREGRLEKIEKDIADAQQKCREILSFEEKIERAERELEGMVELANNGAKAIT
ncbi:hypothetical protein PMAYCL1PPCAC_00483, partial [Pristionchus mayeri]